MEEVWKDINLSSLHTPTGFRGVVLQDFLARPFPKDPVGSTPPPPVAAAARPSLPVLNLNSDPDHHDDQLQFLGPMIPEGPNVRGPVFNVGPLRMPFDDVLMGDNVNGGGLKSLPENGRISGGGERRHKRMIKNRESAARSRARKQAYTNELELEVERLKEENARLRKLQQQQQLSEEASAAEDQFPKKSTLQRTSTAPF